MSPEKLRESIADTAPTLAYACPWAHPSDAGESGADERQSDMAHGQACKRRE